MSYVEDLIESYRRFVALPWPKTVAPPQRVWMAVYPPKYERRLRLNLQEFRNATVQAGHPWECIDITTSFERWLAGHEYAEAYFEEPELLERRSRRSSIIWSPRYRDSLRSTTSPRASWGCSAPARCSAWGTP